MRPVRERLAPFASRASVLLTRALPLVFGLAFGFVWMSAADDGRVELAGQRYDGLVLACAVTGGWLAIALLAGVSSLAADPHAPGAGSAKGLLVVQAGLLVLLVVAALAVLTW